MIGVAFLSLGLVSTIIGIFLLFYPRKPQATVLTKNSFVERNNKVIESKQVESVKEIFPQKHIHDKQFNLGESKILENKSPEDLKIEAERKGIDFEKFVVKKFNKNYFTLTEWTSDKFIDGIYAENTLGPDLVLQFSLRDISEEIAVECKWRKRLTSKYDIVSAQQIKNYQNFEQKRNIPVYLILGVGGEPSSPEKLYIVPLAKILSTDLSEVFLTDYIQDVNTNFFYDYKVKSLTAKQVIKIKEQS